MIGIHTIHGGWGQGPDRTGPEIWVMGIYVYIYMYFFQKVYINQRKGLIKEKERKRICRGMICMMYIFVEDQRRWGFWGGGREFLRS